MSKLKKGDRVVDTLFPGRGPSTIIDIVDDLIIIEYDNYENPFRPQHELTYTVSTLTGNQIEVDSKHLVYTYRHYMLRFELLSIVSKDIKILTDE